jgi:peptide chain release factor 1
MLQELAAVEKRYEEIERLLEDPEVSVDYARVQRLSRELASLKELAFLARENLKVTRDLEATLSILRDGSDPEMASLARDELAKLEAKKAHVEGQIRLALVPQDPNAEKNVIMEIRAGSGGEEAGLFAANLYRMYSRYAQRKGWLIDVVNSNETGLGSIKEIVFQVKGKGAYSRLKHESGGHRVQRIPVTEAGGRIHTSAATVAVLPEAEEVDVDVRPDDLVIDIYHASGHGGQNVQKVATAVRITHTPTGITAICQDERSQLKNKEKAMAVLRSRILAREIERQQKEISEERRSQVGSGDRSDRVRTYNFPQDRVTDHRTSLTVHNLEAVLDGDIDVLVDALLAREQALRLEEAGL